MKHIHLLIAIFVLFSSVNTKAQLFLDNSYSVDTMMMDFFDGHCASISNVVYQGGSNMISFFDADSLNLGVDAGIFFSTGNVFEADTAASYWAGSVMSQDGDSSLNALIPGYWTYDASVVEFDMIPDSSAISFRYVFGSEEYPEYVGSSFNDVFGFFISGPNPAGGYYEEENIATLPNDTVVSINSVNDLTNSAYYQANDASLFIVFDGLTVALDAIASVIPDSTYHVKIGVADAGDYIFDSGVFLSVQSMCADSLLGPNSNFSYQLSGKTEALNVVSVLNHSKYAREFLWNFGDGFTTTERNPAPHTYLNPGTYTISLTVSNYCCIDISSQSVTIEFDPSGIELLNENGFTAYPNPVMDELFVQSVSGEEATVFISDVTGKTVETVTLVDEVMIDMENYSAGIYFLNIVTENKTLTSKLIKE